MARTLLLQNISLVVNRLYLQSTVLNDELHYAKPVKSQYGVCTMLAVVINYFSLSRDNHHKLCGLFFHKGPNSGDHPLGF